MKLVKCIVREAKVEATTDALKQLDVSGLTVTHVGDADGGRIPQPCFVAANTRFPIATK